MTHIAIIGGGPAGYVAAITAAQNGCKVTIIEKASLGGACLNTGCIPTKTLLESAEIVKTIQNAAHYGVDLPEGSASINWNVLQERKQKIVHQLVAGVEQLMKKNKITVLNGQAFFQDPQTLVVKSDNQEKQIQADKVIIAAGSEPVELPFAPFDGQWVIENTGALSLPSVPKSMFIVGGGVIGCEFASVYSRMGTKVTIVEPAEHLLAGEDTDISAVLQKELEKDGVIIYTNATLKKIDIKEKKVFFEHNGKMRSEKTEYVLVSVGRKPKIDELQLEAAGINSSKAGIAVNKHLQTNVPHIYACGDVIGGAQLAHVAFHEGAVAANHASGKNSEVNYRAVPRCVYTSPEVATVGLTETEARKKYGEQIRIGEFPFSANGKAVVAGATAGKVKVIVEPKTKEIIGMTMVGPHATELIGQGTLMVHAEMTADRLYDFIATHPALSEAVHEALLDTESRAIHI